jgi:hypothetical protein
MKSEIRAIYPVDAARSALGLLSMKLGFICPNLPGHLNLMTALAGQLQTRNHDVVFLYSVGAAGLPFISADENGAIRTRNSRIPELRVIC